MEFSCVPVQMSKRSMNTWASAPGGLHLQGVPPTILVVDDEPVVCR